MSFCSRCGAYIPMEETVCPACGYDPEAEKKAYEAARAEEERRKAEEERKKAEEARRRAEEEQRRREEETRRAEEQRKAEEQRRAEEAQNRYRTSHRTGSYSAYRSTSQRKGAAQSGQQGEWKAPWENQSCDPTADYRRAQARDSVRHQRLSMLSYLGPLFFIPMLRQDRDPFTRFHSNQGLVLFLFEVVVNVLSQWLTGIGWLLSLVGGVFALTCIVRGIRNVRDGKMEKLPLIGDIELL